MRRSCGNEKKKNEKDTHLCAISHQYSFANASAVELLILKTVKICLMMFSESTTLLKNTVVIMTGIFT
jgi:hypothetical protein